MVIVEECQLSMLGMGFSILLFLLKTSWGTLSISQV